MNRGRIDPVGRWSWSHGKYVGGGSDYVLTPTRKNITLLHSKHSMDNSASFISSRMKDLCHKIEGYANFRGAYRLPGTGIVEWLEINDVWCNPKQFDGLTWLTLTPVFYDKSPSLLWSIYSLLTRRPWNVTVFKGTLTGGDGKCVTWKWWTK